MINTSKLETVLGTLYIAKSRYSTREISRVNNRGKRQSTTFQYVPFCSHNIKYNILHITQTNAIMSDNKGNNKKAIFGIIAAITVISTVIFLPIALNKGDCRDDLVSCYLPEKLHNATEVSVTQMNRNRLLPYFHSSLRLVHFLVID